MGNKGAIGISVNLDGKTFLFVNAHLAGTSLPDAYGYSILMNIQLMAVKCTTAWPT